MGCREVSIGVHTYDSNNILLENTQCWAEKNTKSNQPKQKQSRAKHQQSKIRKMHARKIKHKHVYAHMHHKYAGRTCSRNAPGLFFSAAAAGSLTG